MDCIACTIYIYFRRYDSVRIHLKCIFPPWVILLDEASTTTYHRYLCIFNFLVIFPLICSCIFSFPLQKTPFSRDVPFEAVPIPESKCQSVLSTPSFQVSRSTPCLIIYFSKFQMMIIILPLWLKSFFDQPSLENTSTSIMLMVCVQI